MFNPLSPKNNKRFALTFPLVLSFILLALIFGPAGSRAKRARSLKSQDISPLPQAEQRPSRIDLDEQDKSSTAAQSDGDEGEDVDPDLGKFGGRIDRETYLRKRDEFIALKRGIEPGRPFDPAARGRAIEQMERQEKAGLLESIVSGTLSAPITTQAAWTALGPAPLPNGVGTNPVSGRVTAIVVDPSNSSTVYLGTAQGGVWRSLDGGATWASIFDNAQSLAIGALALAPSNPTILYVGTGETNRCGDCFFGAGLYRIDNVDTSATLVGPINPAFSFSSGSGTVNTTVFTGRSISSIVVSPSDPATVFVGTSSGVGGSGANSLSQFVPPLALLGVYRSTNATAAAGSVTFQKLAVATAGGSLDVPATGNRRITDMIMEPGNPNNLIVGVFGNDAPNDGGIFRSTNAVVAATPTFAHVLQISSTRIQFAINKDINTGVVKVLAATSETPSPTCSASSQQGVLRQSVDGGASWPSSTATATTGGILTGAGGFCGTQCFYNVTVAIDPKNANAIYVGGNVNSTCSGLMKSSFNNTTSTFDGVTFRNDSSGLHADSHALAMDPLTTPTTVFTGNDGGVWKRSAGAAAVGTAWTNLNNASLNTLQFEGIAVHPLDRNLMIGGTQDNGTEDQQTSGGNWSQAEGGDGGYCLIDRTATDTTNVTMYHTFFNETGTQIGFDRIINTGCLAIKNSWPTRGAGFGTDPTPIACDGGTPNVATNGISLTDSVLFYAPMALGPGSPNTLYFGTDRLYRSTDRGDTMTVVSQASISSPGSNGSPVSTIAISPQDDNYRIVGLQNGRVFATSTGSSTLVEITGGSFPANPNGSATNKFVSRAVIDPNNKNVAYVAFSFFAPAGQGVWKITNLGAAAGASPVAATWTAAGSGIPSIPINALAIDPANSNNIFAGTDIGVYNSTDGGASWVPFGTGLPRSAVFDLALQNANRILRAGTHGRGVWEISIAAAGPPTIQFSASGYSVNEGAGHVTITVTRTGDTSGSASVDYKTVDDPAPVRCDVINHTAYARCDYATTLDTLTFAPGDTSKTFAIPIIDDSYAEGDETFQVALSNAIGASLGSPATATVTITDNDAVNGPNPILLTNPAGVSFFVRQHYLDFLAREPEMGEPWSAILNGCADQFNTDPSSPSAGCDRLTVSGSFFGSPEFLSKGVYTIVFYRVAFTRLPDYLEFAPDLRSVTGATAAETNAKRAAFANNFVLRTEFVNAYGAMTNSTYVTTLMGHYSLSSITTPDPANPDGGTKVTLTTNDLINGLNGSTLTRAQVLRAIVQSDQVSLNFEAVNAFVASQYYGYLRRTPDTGGFNSWVSYLSAHPSDFRTMVNGFMNSIEYRLRFGPT